MEQQQNNPQQPAQQQQPQQPPTGGVHGPAGRRLHIAHRRSPSELTPLMSMFANPGSKFWFHFGISELLSPLSIRFPIVSTVVPIRSFKVFRVSRRTIHLPPKPQSRLNLLHR